MKTLRDFITEAISFKFTDNERKALAEFLMVLLGESSDKDITDKVEVDEDDEEVLRDALDVIEDENRYLRVHYDMIKKEYPVLKKYVMMADDYDLFEDDSDMLDVVEKFNNA